LGSACLYRHDQWCSYRAVAHVQGDCGCATMLVSRLNWKYKPPVLRLRMASFS
jgi:hypothetical protein